MKIIGKVSSIPSPHNNTIEYELDSLTIDGIPYAPPAPEPVRRWILDVAFGAGGLQTFQTEPFATSTRSIAQVPDEHARAKLGFDAQGRVWMADERAKGLARQLRALCHWSGMGRLGQLTIDDLREAADRLAGPEPTP